MTKKASRGLLSYFIAERSLPWWWLGTSMVATTFAADTPLAITGIVANDGISGNWFWWSWIFTFVTITVFFAKKWRSSHVLTDVEFIELRYSGKPAKLLRVFKAFFLSIIINGITLGWVFRAMSKITAPFIDWKLIIDPETLDIVESLWPGIFIFDDINNTLTILIIFFIVVVYSSLGGIRGAILTDLFQFSLALITAIVFAFLAVQYVGGFESLFSQINFLYPENSDDILSFFPKFNNGLFPLEIFLIFIFIQWWAQYYSDGSGYLAQRMNTAKTAQDAEKGALWFTLANFCLRTWPWVIVGLVALVVFPLHDPTQFHAIGKELNSDREMGYPVLMKLILPSGLLGLTFVSLMAAFMSTVDTHINWGASYLVNDVYKRFLRKSASEKELVFISRLSVLLISVLAVIIASQIQSIEKAWKFFIAMGSGLGLPQILRWIWWRTNAWTEIAGMSTAFISSLIFYNYFPETRAEYLLFWIVILSTSASIIITFLTPPVNDHTLNRFIAKTNPLGFWKDDLRFSNQKNKIKLKLKMWSLALIVSFSGMFSIGYFIKLNFFIGTLLLVTFGISFRILLKMMSEDNETDKS